MAEIKPPLAGSTSRTRTPFLSIFVQPLKLRIAFYALSLSTKFGIYILPVSITSTSTSIGDIVSLLLAYYFSHLMCMPYSILHKQVGLTEVYYLVEG